MKFVPGKSGNPVGRRPGQRNHLSLMRERLLPRKRIAAILTTLAKKAEAGDTTAAGLLLDRVWPRLRPVAATMQLDLPEGGDLTAQAQAVIAAMARAEMPPDIAAAIVSALGSLARVKEVDELARRVAALEQTEK